MTSMTEPIENLPTKGRILAAALALFKERGLAGVSTRDVSIASGLSRSHLYHYFADWSAMRNEVFAELAATEIAHMSKVLAKLTPKKALTFFVSELLPSQHDSSWSLWLDAWDEALRDAEFGEIYMSAMRDWEAVLAGIIKSGVKASEFKSDDPQRAAKQLFAMMNGYAADLLLKPSPRAQKLATSDVMAVAGLLLGAKH